MGSSQKGPTREVNGFLLLEDLGDATYTRLLTSGEDEKRLYELAVDVLIKLHKTPLDQVIPEGVIQYGNERLMEEVERLMKGDKSGRVSR